MKKIKKKWVGTLWLRTKRINKEVKKEWTNLVNKWALSLYKKKET